jgi:hypothetical protein
MRKHCRRKIYSLVNPISLAIDGVRITPKSALDDLRLRELAAIESFAKGKATLQDWCDINAMLSGAETMALAGVGPEALVDCKSAQQALIEAARRFESTKRMVIFVCSVVLVAGICVLSVCGGDR